MPTTLLAPFFADLFGFSPNHFVALVIPLAAIVLAGVVTVSAMYFHHRRRELWHETARIALEKGQPLPPLDPDQAEHAHSSQSKNRDDNHDVRGGLVLIAVGAGLFLMLGSLSSNLRLIGAIPGFIGIALLLYALLAALLRRKQPDSDRDATPRS